MHRRRFLLAAAGFSGAALLAACSSNNKNSSSNQPTNSNAASGNRSSTGSGNGSVATAAAAALAATGTPAAGPVGLATVPATAAPGADVNDLGWPKSITKLSVGELPSEADPALQKQDAQPLIDLFSKGLGIPVDLSITTSYGALVEAQKNKQVELGYYGPLSFLLAEQQFGAIPLVVDGPAPDKPGNYHSVLIAGKNSPVKTVADIKGKDFTFVDPASTSGYLFPIAMLKAAGIDPQKDIKARFAGSHGNSIVAVGKGTVPCGATNDGNLAQAISQGIVAKDDIVVLQTSPDIPNSPFAARPDMDKRAVAKVVNLMVGFQNPDYMKKNGLQQYFVPINTSLFDYVRQVAKLIDLQFDQKGNSVIPNAPTPVATP
jgi:phosphonate transport system substrate-binding protein